MIFLFFGHPGAGKSTLAARFGALHHLTAIDTDLFMTLEERRAASDGQYTQAMRLANIVRYANHVRQTPDIGPGIGPHVALADGLPNDAARRFALRQFPAGTVVLVLVQTDRLLWEERLSARSDNPVAVSVREADAYIRDNWEPVAPDLLHELIDNNDPARMDTLLQQLYERYTGDQSAI